VFAAARPTLDRMAHIPSTSTSDLDLIEEACRRLAVMYRAEGEKQKNFLLRKQCSAKRYLHEWDGYRSRS
jgi:hypothetical protein